MLSYSQHSMDETAGHGRHTGWVDVVRPDPDSELCLMAEQKREIRLFFDPRESEIEVQGGDVAFVFPDNGRVVVMRLIELAERGEAGDVVTADGVILSVLDLLRMAQHVDSLARALAGMGA